MGGESPLNPHYGSVSGLRPDARIPTRNGIHGQRIGALPKRCGPRRQQAGPGPWSPLTCTKGSYYQPSRSVLAGQMRTLKSNASDHGPQLSTAVPRRDWKQPFGSMLPKAIRPRKQRRINSCRGTNPLRSEGSTQVPDREILANLEKHRVERRPWLSTVWVRLGLEAVLRLHIAEYLREAWK